MQSSSARNDFVIGYMERWICRWLKMARRGEADCMKSRNASMPTCYSRAVQLVISTVSCLPFPPFSFLLTAFPLSNSRSPPEEGCRKSRRSQSRQTQVSPAEKHSIYISIARLLTPCASPSAFPHPPTQHGALSSPQSHTSPASTLKYPRRRKTSRVGCTSPC